MRTCKTQRKGKTQQAVPIAPPPPPLYMVDSLYQK